MKSPAECITLLIEFSVTCDLCPGLVTCDLRFVPTDTGTMAVDQAHFPLESDEEMAETNDTPPSKKKSAWETKTLMAAGTYRQNAVEPETLIY